MTEAELRKVTWLDSNNHAGWHDPEIQHYGPIKAVSVGFVIDETDESVTLGSSVVFGDDFQASNTMTIPKVCIVSSKTLAKR